jgi:DUF4097 and DUF4098 domain-containing protein YvlB
MKQHIGFVVIVSMTAFSILACQVGEIRSSQTQWHSQIEEQSFAVSDAPSLTVDNYYGGNITVNAGEDGTIQVVATKKAGREGDLDQIEIEITEQDGGLEIKTEKSTRLQNVSVDFEITVPATAQVDLYTTVGNVSIGDLDGQVQVETMAGNVRIDGGSGQIDVQTMGGNIDIHNTNGEVDAQTMGGNIDISGGSDRVDARTMGGNIDVRDANGLIRLETNGGDVDYQGHPEGDCRFETGGGDIKLRLPADINVEIELKTPSTTCDTCNIKVDFDVDGQVSQRRVSGTIGSGDEGKIYAETRGGDIDLIHQ